MGAPKSRNSGTAEAPSSSNDSGNPGRNSLLGSRTGEITGAALGSRLRRSVRVGSATGSLRDRNDIEITGRITAKEAVQLALNIRVYIGNRSNGRSGINIEVIRDNLVLILVLDTWLKGNLILGCHLGR